MMNFNTEDLQTFLIQTELVNQKVKALAENRLSPQQFDRLEVVRAQDKRKRQEGVKRRERQALQRKKLGRQGKGITKDYLNFCRFCHRQYDLPTPICVRCNRNTMTLKERQEQLQVMVSQYKDKKKKRQQRKMKWDMWQKTKSMLWKKTSNNYDKWEYFVSDSQQQPEKQPIVPKNDPNFKALQRDFEQRKALRQKDTKKAKQLKQKGNAFMKQGKYQQAKNMYTLALEHIKDMKSIYTNRALAYIKLGKFRRAIKDCTNVIEYIQLFEKNEQCKDTLFKAYLRRSSAKKQLKQYKQALQDVNKALSFYPNDKSGEILKKQLQGFISYSSNVERLLKQNSKNPEANKQKSVVVKEEQEDNFQNKEEDEKLPTEQQSKLEQQLIIKELAEAQLSSQPVQKKQTTIQKQEAAVQPKKVEQKTQNQYSNPIQQIKQRVQNLTQQNIVAIFRLLRQKPELINIFIASKGINKCLNQLIKAEQCKKQGYLVSVCLRGDGVGEKQVWDFGIDKLYSRISQFLNNATQINMSRYFILEDMFQILIPMSLHQKYRMLLSDSNSTYTFLQRTFSQLLSKNKKQPDLFSSILIYMGNLCSGNSKLRESYISQQKFKVIVSSLYDKVITRKTVNRSYISLKKNVYSLLANLVINQNHRVNLIHFLNQKQQTSQNQGTKWEQLVKQLKYFPKSNQIFQEYVEALLSLMANVSLGTQLNVPGLAECINQRYLSNPSTYSPEILYRALLTVSRIKYQNPKIFSSYLKNFETNLQLLKKKKGDKNNMEHIVRLLNIMYSPIQGQTKFSQPLPKNLFKQLKSYISSLQSGQILFCNTCNLFGVILDNRNQNSANLYKQLKQNIKFLIQVAKQKVGNWRKNASILLAKLSINPECKQQLYAHHGMEVLKSIAQFVKQK